ncbi:heme o synthase [Bauldia litoralis]|uniref:Protoheme IX farnesyltransferase n=1 Tax=Bauldia litoralis TaxID=665467 RepID=A0A1G6C6H5_9HYPH|nr:heme o synthase [Bauldia litoralis]SDB28493.1 protoheme IX farnesyltransferase [Bauldia litoralis]
MAYVERSEIDPSIDAEEPLGSVGDFFALLKPRVMSLVIFTALTGMVMAPAGVHPILAVAALIAIAVGAGASGALNMWYDADIDKVMRRTRGRPVAAGRMAPGDALAFGAMLSVASVTFLGLATNWLAAGLLAFTIFFYAVVYTMWLKRWTPQNIVIGGAAGALPPVIGWAAVTGTVSIESLVLFAIIFLWTPPHFWALSLYKTEDYRRAGVPMLPVVAGAAATRRQILAYSVVMALAAMAPFVLGFAGIAYAVIAGVSGIAFVGLALRVYRSEANPAGERAARDLFAFSILYLFVLFAVLLVEALGFGGGLA